MNITYYDLHLNLLATKMDCWTRKMSTISILYFWVKGLERNFRVQRTNYTQPPITAAGEQGTEGQNWVQVR
jgi:hypothetical protein